MFEKEIEDLKKGTKETEWLVAGAETLPRLGMLLLFLTAWKAAGTGEVIEFIGGIDGVLVAGLLMLAGQILRIWGALKKDHKTDVLGFGVFFDFLLGCLAVAAGLLFFQYNEGTLTQEKISNLAFLFSMIAMFFHMLYRTFEK